MLLKEVLVVFLYCGSTSGRSRRFLRWDLKNFLEACQALKILLIRKGDWVPRSTNYVLTEEPVDSGYEIAEWVLLQSTSQTLSDQK